MRFTDSYGEQSCTAGRVVVHHRPERVPHRAEQGRDAGRRRRAAGRGRRRSRSCSSRSATRPGSSARTTSATSTSSCRPSTASTSSSATSTTSTPRRSRRRPNWPPAEDFPRFNERFRPARRPPLVGDRRRRRHRGPALRARRPPADRGHRAADARSGWRRSTTRCSSTRSTSSTARPPPDTPFFCWFNTTHMHFRTHPKPESVGQAGRWQSPYHDTMIDHDKVVGALLDKLDELGLAEDTIVIYSTDNGPHMNTWPDGGMTPFRSEKNTNWEGAFRVPEMIRWPGQIPAGVGLERDRPAPRLAADVPRRRRRAGHRREAQGRATRSATRPTRSTSTATTCCRT